MIGMRAAWAIGAGGSLAVHLLLVPALALALRPAPVTQQDGVESRLDLQAYALERQAAPERRPEAEGAAAVAASGQTLESGVVARTRLAAAQVPLSGRLNSERTPAQALSSSSVQPTTLSSSSFGATSINAIPESAPRVAATHARPVQAVAAVPHIENAPPRTGVAVPIAEARPAVAPAPPLPQDPDRITAALAFDGGDGEIDPVSLAAFQSFMRPGDIATRTDPTRDKVSELLAQVPCARLQVSFDPETARLHVLGHIPEDGLRTPVLSALQTEMGDDITVEDRVLILPRPQCGALSGIAAVGLPQSTDQITNPLLIGENTQARVLDFVRDDRLVFDLIAPDYDAYLYVDYFDADGNVLHLSPNDHAPLQVIAARAPVQVGARGPEDSGLQIFVGPPYGQEIAVAFAASRPLYETPRPLIEPAASYLDWMKERVAAARAEDPTFKGEWVYFFVSTAPE